MKTTQNYRTWKKQARKYDELSGVYQWRQEKSSRFYNWKTLQYFADKLEKYIKQKEIHKLQ